MREIEKLHELDVKYADGGKVGGVLSALAAVRAAIAHLGTGDHAQAVSVLRGSPEAQAHPVLKQLTDQMHAATPDLWPPESHDPLTRGLQSIVGHAAGGKIVENANKMFVKDGQDLADPVSVPIASLRQTRILDPQNVMNIHKSMGEGKDIPPVVIDSAGHVLDGNHRVAAAKLHGHTHIKAHEVHDKKAGPAFADGGSTGPLQVPGLGAGALPAGVNGADLLGSLHTAISQNPQMANALRYQAMTALMKSLGGGGVDPAAQFSLATSGS